MKAKTNWIWLKDWKAEDKEEVVKVLFRKVIDIKQCPEKAILKISADSRYKLYVNGSLVEVGPSKGDAQIWFYDEVQFASYLQEGENIIAVQVLRYPQIHNKGNHGIFRTEFPGLFLQADMTFADGHMESFCADDSWKVCIDKGFSIVSESEVFAPLQIYEMCYGVPELHGWMTSGYDASTWKNAVEYPSLSQAVSPGNLFPRTIPFLYRKERKFQEITTIRESVYMQSQWEDFLHEKKAIVIPPNSREIIEISAGEEMTGYLHLDLNGGKDTDITILQSECYVTDQYRNGLPVKDRRDDWENGHLEGFCDHYRVAGCGTYDMPEKYEPFWFRTFRYIRLEIVTKEVPLTLLDFHYTETGYPLDVKTKIQISNPEMNLIWDMSERTLRRCMHETYEDCPFYEQLQYAMDSRQQILYTYAISADDRLARKCMDDFRRSQRYDGLINCSYPNYGPNVIPGFSIYYILMLHDHMMYFGDKELLEMHVPCVEGILNYFHRHQKNGIVEKTGGLNGQRFWSFIDWTPEWDQTTGVPKATLSGPITMESLLYVMGLEHAADILEYIGNTSQSELYRLRSQNTKEAVRQFCTGKNGMLQDGPGIEQYSQHTQVFGALTDTVDLKTAKANIEKTLLSPEKYAQCSVAMSFYLFRALEKTGLYQWTEQCWDIWRRMLEKGATTCVEDAVGERSECHAWGALILYELPSVLLGVRPEKPGYREISINPHIYGIENVKGDILTPVGTVHVEGDGQGGLRYELPNHKVIVKKGRE